jgi:opacity protein-like surface antigen
MTKTTTAPLRKAPLSAALLAGALAVATAAGAQAEERPRVVRAPSTLRAFGDLGYRSFAATQSFLAILGRSSGWTPGGGAAFVWRDRVLLEVGGSRFREDGQRVLRFNSQTYGLGVPVTVSVTQVDATAGYRFRVLRRLYPYLGLGVGTHSYQETSRFAEPSENVDRRKSSYHAAAGLEVRVGRWLAVGGQARYAWVTGVLGTDGVSKEFGETDLSGPSLRFRILVGPEL